MNLKLTTPDLSSTFNIVGYIGNSNDYLVGSGYLDDDNKIWICKNPNDVITEYPWFYYQDGEFTYSNRNEYDDKVFTRRNCVNLDIESIRNNIDACIDEYKKASLPISDDIELYEIKNQDTCLSTLIKLFLNDTKVDLSLLGTIIDDPVTISNLKSSLKRTDLSLKNFMRWVSVLGLKYTIILEDNGTGISNLNGDRFIYQSDTNVVSRLSKDNKI